jgi:WD40 repeat protein
LQGAIPSEPDFRIFSASLDNTMRLWDPYDMACVRVMSESESEISAMTFYEAWNILVTGV